MLRATNLSHSQSADPSLILKAEPVLLKGAVQVDGPEVAPQLHAPELDAVVRREGGDPRPLGVDQQRRARNPQSARGVRGRGARALAPGSRGRSWRPRRRAWIRLTAGVSIMSHKPRICGYFVTLWVPFPAARAAILEQARRHHPGPRRNARGVGVCHA